MIGTSDSVVFTFTTFLCQNQVLLLYVTGFWICQKIMTVMKRLDTSAGKAGKLKRCRFDFLFFLGCGFVDVVFALECLECLRCQRQRCSCQCPDVFDSRPTSQALGWTARTVNTLSLWLLFNTVGTWAPGTHTALFTIIFHLLQAYRKLAKEYHPDKNPDAGDKVWCTKACYVNTIVSSSRSSIAQQLGPRNDVNLVCHGHTARLFED